jgi:plasmid maintenance system antidote protein VapI
MALKLGAALGTTAEFWMNAQLAVDLYHATQRSTRLPKPLPRAS